MSKINLVNRSLTHIGANRITSLSEDTVEAQVVNAMYDESLQSVLGECKWNFATKRVVLSQLDVDLAWGSGNVFQLPSDLIRLFDNNITNDYTIEGETLITEATSVGIRYVYKNDDVSKYPPYFKDALVMRIAYDISYKLNNSKSATTDLLKLYEGHYLPKAISKNAQDKTPEKVTSNAWVESVYGKVV